MTQDEQSVRPLLKKWATVAATHVTTVLKASAAAVSASVLMGVLGCAGGADPVGEVPGVGHSGKDDPASMPAPAGPGSGPSTPGGEEPTGDPAGKTSTPAGARHARCGWIGADTASAGAEAFAAHARHFDAIHPKWFVLRADGSVRVLTMADDPVVTQVARSNGVQLIPLVYGEKDDYLRGVFSSPARIAAHAEELAALAVERGYEGLELDYEHLWEASDRPGFTALIEAIGAALHAEGKVLTLAIPALEQDTKRNAYDYAALQRAADVLHLMAYDFHYLGGSHQGPLAPAGWVRAVAARVQQLGSPEKFVLGLANYAVGSGWYGSAAGAITDCGTSKTSDTDHMRSCPLGSFEAGRAPHCRDARGEVWFEDPESIAEKAEIARAHGLGGISYWTLGDEAPGFFEAISAAYP